MKINPSIKYIQLVILASKHLCDSPKISIAVSPLLFFHLLYFSSGTAVFSMGKRKSKAVGQSGTSFGNERILLSTNVLPGSTALFCGIRYKKYIRLEESFLP